MIWKQRKYWLTLLILSTLANITVSQATVRVVERGGPTSSYSTLSAALTASSAGDTIFISGTHGPWDGSSYTINRPLTIIGAGLWGQFGEYTELRNSSFRFSTGSSGSVLVGISCTGEAGAGKIHIDDNVSNLLFWRCHISNSHTYSEEMIQVSNNCNNIQFSECVLQVNTIPDNPSCFNISDNSSVTVRNSILSAKVAIVEGNDANSVIDFHNCTILRTANLKSGNVTANFYDCVLYPIENAVTSLLNVQYRYCASNQTLPGASNILLTTDPFANYTHNRSVNYNQFVPDTTDVHPAIGSPLINAADPNASSDRDGSRADIGCYGGPSPFTDGGAPAFPVVSRITIPATIPAGQPLPINATGRVGPR